MRTYEIAAPDGKTYQIEGPEGATKAQLVQFLLAKNPYAGQSTQELKEAPSAPSKLKDVGIAALTGLAGGAQSLTDLFGAGNIASKGLSSVQQSAQEGLSEARKAEIARDEELKKRAEGSFLDEAGAGFRSFGNAPLQEGIQALFSSAPIIAAGALTGGAGAVPLTAARAGLAARAAQAGRVATSGTGVGAAMGLGGQKGQDYETVKRELMARGMPEPEAEAKAQEAAAYSLQNLPRQAVAAGAGALEGRYGVEGALSNFMKQRAATAAAGKAFTPELPPGYGKAAVSSIFGEMIPEGIQAATGQVGTNIALTQAGIPTDALKGVTSAVAHDAAVAALLGTAVTPFQKANMVREFNQTMIERQQKAFEEEAKRREEFERKRQEDIAKTRQELGIEEKPPLLLESDLYLDEKTGELKSKTKLDAAAPVTDPLINPLGNLTKDELGQAVGVSDVYKFVDNYRRKNNLPKLETYSIEDLKDAQPGLAEAGEKGSLESILTFKTGYEANTPISADNVLNTALQKNVETGTKGWNDFLARTTGNNSLDTMSGPELLAVSQALSRLPDSKPESAPIVLPEGTNAKLFKQSQYDSAVRAVDTALSGQGLSLTPGPMTEQDTLDVIKQATGLTLDKHAKAILDTAVKQGDFDLEMTPKYEVTDPATGVRVGDLYETRKEAQAAAKPKGLNVNEVTESAVVAPKTATVLPDEFDIQEGEFKAGEAPDGFDIMAGNKVLAKTTSYEDAAERIEGFTKIRQRMADQALAQVTKLQEEIANSQSDLEEMEAKGQANTQEYINARGAHARLLKDQEAKTNEAFDRADEYNPATNPITIKPRKLAPVRRRGLTVLQKGIPSATFPNRTAAEEHIIANMSDQQLKKLTKTEGRRTLAKRALAELQAREDKKAGITKGFAVKRSEIEGEPEVSQEVKDKIAELEKFLLPALRNLGLNDVALKIEQSIAGGRAGGSYYKSLIKIAMDEENPLLTMRHEALHALKALGFFTPQQWATLERKARTEWVNKYLHQRTSDNKPIQPGKNSRYFDYQYINIIEPTAWNQENPDKPQRTVMSQADFMDLIIEEAIADAFADFTVNKPPAGMIAALMQRLNKFFEALRNAMAGAGFQTVDDIFGKVEAGELKALGQGPGGTKTKLSMTAEKVEEVDPKDVGNIVTNSAYKDAGTNVLGSQIEKTSKPLEVDDVGKLFDDAYMAEFGKAGDWRNPVDFKRAVVQAVDELKFQMQQAKSGLDWYDEDVAEAFKLTQRYIPSLKNPEKRALFSVIAGIMSPSTNARDNWVIAAQAYQHYEKTGTLPGTNPATGGLWMGGLESANKKKQLDMLNAMLQPKSKGGLGEKGAVEWLQGMHTVAEITSFRSKYGGMGKSSTGGKATDMLPGFTAFGPKVGPFVMNINGIHEVTVDVWMTRTFNRYFGQMMGPDGKMVRAPTEPQRVAIKNLAVLTAQQLGIKPYQVQSMLWFMEQQIFNKLGTGAKSYGFSDGATKFSETQGGVGVSKVPPANSGANAPANKPTGKQAVGTGVQASKLSVRSTGQEVTDENIRSAKPAIRPGDQGGRGITEDQAGRGNRRGRDSGRGTTPLAGAPTVQGATGPDPEIVNVAEAYAATNNIPYSPQESYVEVDEDRARRLAQAYEDMPHAPKDPAVQAAYKDLIEQTRAQYDALTDAGYKFTFFDSETDPYGGNPWNAMRDLRQNKKMAVYGTYDGFGTEGLTDTAVEDNPMLEDTGLRWEDQNGVEQIVTANDLFRAVHDAFGHGLEGAGFRARGEENAWQAHARLFTGPALAAITSETRGQNSWLNYGPYAEKNQNAKVQDTVFAEQKTGLMPDWTWTEGLPKLSVRGKQGVVLGTLQPGAASFSGAHYGNAKVDTLNGDKYGTGIRGAERRRLDETGDDRIRRRVYFYVAKEDGVMPTPEAGLGQYVYTQQFDNILPPGAEMSKLYSQANANSNQFESAVIDAGYDGYAIPNMGMMVVLNHNAPVQYRGTRVEMAERGEKLSIRPPPLVGRIAPNTPEFKRFFNGSKAVNDDGSPRLMFHGTVETPGEEGNLFSTFNLSDDGKLGSGVYTTSVPVYAETFGFSQPALMPLYLSAKNPYYIELGDFPTRMKGDNLALTDEAFNSLETQMKEAATKLSGKRLMDLEGSQVRKMFEKAGYDSIIARDSYGNIIEALAFKPEQVKSATGNKGTYDPTNPDIRYSLRAPDTKEFKQWFGSSKVVDEGGEPLVVYHGSRKFKGNKFKPDVKRVNRAGNVAGYYFAPDPDEASGYAKNRATGEYEEGAQVLPAFLSIENPYIAGESRVTPAMIRQYKKELVALNQHMSDEKVEEWSETKLPRFTDGRLPDSNALNGDGDAMQRILKAGGYDGFKDGSHWVAFESTQVKSATGNKGKYNPANPDVRLSVRNIIGDQKVIDAYLSTTTAREEKGHAARMLDAITPPTYTSLRQMFLNQYDSLARLDTRYAKAKGIVRLMADSSAEAAALMSDMAAGVAARVIGMGGSAGGAPVFRNGATYIDNKNGTIKGPALIFVPLAKYNNPEIYQAYQYWAGVQRGSRYIQNPNGTYEEKLFNKPSDIAYANHLLTKFPEFKQVQADWNLYNDALVDYQVSTGVISKEGGEKLKKHGDYIPFYRQLEGEETIGPKVYQNISGVKPPKRAKGSEAPLADFLETVVRNTQAAIQAGMKNAAAIRTIDMLLDPQINQATKINKPQGINTISILRNGQIEHYHVSDVLLVDSLKSLNLAKLPGLGILSGPANLLRTLVTKDPGFMLINLMRDSMSAWVTSGQDFKPGIDTIRYFGKALTGNSPEVEAILNFGMGGYEFSRGVEQSGRDLAATLKKKTQGKRTLGQKVLNAGPSLWEALEKGTTASDMATRAAIYKSVMKETGNETEALMRALEVMNFNRRGNSVVVRIATAAIPFFNARMQGLDVLYRAGIRPYKRQLVNLASDTFKLGLEKQETTEYEKQIAKTFAIRGLTMMAVSSLYWAMTHDDDEYLTQEQELKDNNFLLPSLGLRLPIPFEVGVMFKVIPERLLEYAFGKDTGKDFSEAMVRNIKSSLFMDLMPQTFKPIYEVTTNYNFYTRRPIVGQGAEGLAAEYEVGPGTSSFAESLGKTLGYSPLKLDHLIKAYTGTIGTYGVFLIDNVIDANSNVPKASLRFEQLPFFRRFTLDKDARGKQTAYYDLKNSVDEVVRTVNHLEKAGNYEEMGEYMKDNMRILASKEYISAIDKEMKSFQEMGNMIRSSKMSGDEKRDALLAVTQARNKLTGNIQEIKKMIASGD